MVTEKEAVEFLLSRTKFGIKLGLETISELLAEHNNPHLKYPTVHIAGTNGKGSTASYISAILQQHGLKVGLYTSPHLISVNERIRINGVAISNHDFIFHLSRFKTKAEQLQATFFDTLTAIAFNYFAAEHVDAAVIETGMGGRFDSTNVVSPMVSVITSIGMDHEKYLGDSIEKIAFEKAGIIKQNKPVFVGKLSDSAMTVIKKTASENNSSFYSFSRDFENYLEHNKYLAVETGEFVLTQLGVNVNNQLVESAVMNMPQLTGLHGRFDKLKIMDKTIILDAAHNPDGAEAFVKSYRSEFKAEPLIVFGAVADKNYHDMLFHLRKLSDSVYLTLPALNRGNTLDNLARSAADLEFKTESFESVAVAVETAIKQSRFPIIVFCGSIYLLGEVYSVLFDRFIPNEMPRGLTINQ